MLKRQWDPRVVGGIMIALMLIGIYLRVKRYTLGFPFWGDEAWVAQEIIRRTPQDILSNKDLVPSLSLPPVGFLFLEKMLVLWAGYSEIVMRSFPCLCGVASIFIYRKLLRTLAGLEVQLIAMTFFVFSGPLLMYSSELKQYSSDVFFALIIWHLHFQAVKKSMKALLTRRLALAGIAAIIFSLPVILVLISLSLTQAVIYFKRKQSRQMQRCLLLFFVWMAVFGLFWSQYYHVNYGDKDVLGYKSPYYLSLPFLEVDGRVWAQKVLTIFQSPVELSSAGLAALLFLGGGWVWWRRERSTLLVLLMPLIFTIGLSSLNKYPFSGRFLIFLLPVLFLLIAEGVVWLMNGGRYRKIAGLLLLALLLSRSVAGAGDYFQPRAVTDMRSLLIYLRENQKKDDSVYFNNESQWGFNIYYYFYPLLYASKYEERSLQVQGVLFEHPLSQDRPGQLFYLFSPDRTRRGWVYAWDRVVDKNGLVSALPGAGRTWVLLTQISPQKAGAILRCFDAMGQRLEEKHSQDAALYLYEINPERSR